MNKLLPFGLLLLMGCEQSVAPIRPVTSQQGSTADQALAATSTDSYMRGFAQYEQCLWGNGICAVAASPDMETGRSGPALRTPRVRLTLRGQRLDVQFLTPFDPAVRVLTIRPNEEFFVAQPETDALGVNALKIKRGAYPVDANMGQYGGMHFNVQVF
ncbi:hypothetical protein [Hymenobacter rigui]|uniref:Lipoprotein n=1 Tax=Hymenobacter rigui TaxID=334424 RepID=A0A3R9NJZ2_9BACT|nr:hypothetical protein [Hymenobacter rigui]RSK48817.1 hypothetical protein EI291_09635 [Hymenobacter rigui]